MNVDFASYRTAYERNQQDRTRVATLKPRCHPSEHNKVVVETRALGARGGTSAGGCGFLCTSWEAMNHNRASSKITYELSNASG